MAFKDILYTIDGRVAVITLNRPEFKNAQSWALLDEVDQAFAMAGADKDVRVVVVKGAGGNFSAGHDIGTPARDDQNTARANGTALEWYDGFKKYNLDLLLKWRAFGKPTIAMVDGYCIYGGWMLAACMDLVFADDDAQFLGGLVEYMSIPWDIGVRRAKEISFESRFITAAEAAEFGLVNRVYAPADLERETMAYAHRVAENSSLHLRISKQMMNRAQDMQGFTDAVENSLTEFVAMMNLPGQDAMQVMEGAKRLSIVDLALKGRRGERYGQTPKKA